MGSHGVNFILCTKLTILVDANIKIHLLSRHSTIATIGMSNMWPRGQIQPLESWNPAHKPLALFCLLI